MNHKCFLLTFSRQCHQAPAVGDGLRQQLGPRLAWTLAGNQPSSQTPTSKGFPNALSRNLTRSRREGDPGGTLEVTEAALVRDILYVFQGIDGKNIKMSSTENCYKVDAKVCYHTCCSTQRRRPHSSLPNHSWGWADWAPKKLHSLI